VPDILSALAQAGAFFIPQSSFFFLCALCAFAPLREALIQESQKVTDTTTKRTRKGVDQ
jgi:hypothetical protein